MPRPRRVAAGAGPPEPAGGAARPYWSRVLRAVREMRSVTQDGWAALLGVGRSTVQRWERGEAVPDAHAEEAIIAACRERGLLRAYDEGPLAGVNLTAAWLSDLLAAARFGRDTPPASLTSTAPPALLPPRSNLPVPLTSFIGRQRELAEVRRLIGTSRLLTLTGAGGVGKTRLALVAAAELHDTFPDGIWLVELAGITDEALAAGAVAAALGVRDQPGRPAIDALMSAVQVRHLLLVLDNSEHVVAACAELADALLRTAPHVHILVTSRERLGVPGEVIWPVPPLSLPSAESEVRSPEAASRQTSDSALRTPDSDAVQLFIERARAARPVFDPAAADMAVIEQICRRLDGLPLALELAAARLTLLTIEQLANRLDDALGVLTDGSRTAPARQQTLRAAIDWSHASLSPAEQVVFRRLAVFAGDFDLEAAEAVAGDRLVSDGDGLSAGIGLVFADGRRPATVLDLLGHLTAKSLVVADNRGETIRYRLLEPVRQYAEEQLVLAGEAALFRCYHRDWCLTLAEQVEPELWGPAQQRGLGRLKIEQGNLRAALAWCTVADDGAEPGLRLAAALLRCWDICGRFAEGREWLTKMLARSDSVRPIVRARALSAMGLLAIREADYAAARALFEECLTLARDQGDIRLTAEALNRLGFISYVSNELTAGHALLDEALATAEAAGDRRIVAGALNNLGLVARGRADFAGARMWMERSLAVWQALGDQRETAGVLNNLAVVADDEGHYAAAQALHEQGLAIKHALDDRWGTAVSLGNLGSVLQKRGDPATARALCTQSLALMRELGDRRGVASALFVLGRLSAFEADYDAARTTVEQALALYRELGLRAMAASASVTLASVVLRQGEAEQARALLEQGLTEARDLGDEQMSAAALTDLGHLAVRAGDHHRAEALLRDALDLLRELRLSGGTIDCLQRLIELAAASRRFEPAAQLLGAVEAMRTASGTPIAAAVRSDCDETAAILCAALGNEEFTAALSAGRALTLEQCMSLAAELLPDGALTPTST